MASAEALNSAGRWLFGLLGRLSLELAILALVVAAVVWALRLRSPALRHAFWGLVLAKPLVTLLVASPLSLYWLLHQAPQPVFPTMPATQTLMPFTPRVPLKMGRLAMPPSSPALAPLSLPVRAVPLNGYGWLFLGWSAAVVALAVRLAAGGVYVRHLTRKAERAHQGLIAELAGRAAAAIGLRRPIPVFLCGDGCGMVLRPAHGPGSRSGLRRTRGLGVRGFEPVRRQSDAGGRAAIRAGAPSPGQHLRGHRIPLCPPRPARAAGHPPADDPGTDPRLGGLSGRAGPDWVAVRGRTPA